ncbi:MAG: hypothetical protein DHS20C16_10790 [Phycisphaerae bacterium]|nr:MAG: hypothetical protein DHS20C16_10790 [Phycisphaerae bacterium]
MAQMTQSNMESYLAGRTSARRGDRWVRLVSSIVAIACLAGAMLLVRPINDIRRNEQMTMDVKIEGLPPDIALMTKLGTLRALAIDVAFIRLEELKEENRFFELMQLSNWLCKLAPRYPTVWKYAAWNMAYNISVCQYSDEARWLWVSNGIKNLRNRGLVYNPKSITLYKELSWTFYHKVGDKLDDSHRAYKAELAVEMEQIFGEPPLVIEDDQAVERFRKIVKAPRNLDAWIEQTPEVKRLIEEMRRKTEEELAEIPGYDELTPEALRQAASEELGLDADKSLLSFVAEHMRTYSSLEQFVLRDDDSPVIPHKRQRELLGDPANAEVVDELCAAVRSDVLRDQNEYNMDIDFMLSLMEEYGPIDWRSPYGHSLYWGAYGDKITTNVKNRDDADSMNAVRFIFFSLDSLSRKGKIVLEPNFQEPGKSFVEYQPDARYIRHMHEAYIKFGKEQFGDDPNFVEGTAGPNYSTGHENFLMRSIRQLYLTGGKKNMEEAKEYYFYLRKFDLDRSGNAKPRYSTTFKAFVERQFKEALDTQAGATVFIQAFLLRSLKEAAVGDVERSIQSFNTAKEWYEYYHRDTKTDRNARRVLQPIGIMRRDIALIFLQRPDFSIPEKARVWKSLDLTTRRAIYDDAMPFVQVQCDAHTPPFDPNKVVPTPPGMEEHRKNPDAVLNELEHYDDSVSRGEKQVVD